MEVMGLGLTGAAVAAVSAWLHINGKDGSGWAVVAVLTLLTTCQIAK